MLNPAYREAYDKGKKTFRVVNPVSMDRDMGVLKQVNFDKNWKPISKKDKENHEWNMKFFKALDDDDYKLQEDMIAETFPHMLDEFEMPKLSIDEIKAYKAEKNKEKQAQLKKALMDKYNAWLEDFLKNGDIPALVQMNKRMLAIDNLGLEHPTMADYRKENKAFENKRLMQVMVGVYISHYMPKTRGFNLGTDVSLVENKFETERAKQKYEKFLDENMDVAFEGLIDKMLEYDAHKNDAPVPYRKSEMTEEENLKRMEDRKLAKTKMERDAARAKIQEEEEKKRREKEALRRLPERKQLPKSRRRHRRGS